MSENEEKQENVEWLTKFLQKVIVEGLGREPTPIEFAMFQFGWTLKTRIDQQIKLNEGDENNESKHSWIN